MKRLKKIKDILYGLICVSIMFALCSGLMLIKTDGVEYNRDIAFILLVISTGLLILFVISYNIIKTKINKLKQWEAWILMLKKMSVEK